MVGKDLIMATLFGSGGGSSGSGGGGAAGGVVFTQGSYTPAESIELSENDANVVINHGLGVVPDYFIIGRFETNLPESNSLDLIVYCNNGFSESGKKEYYVSHTSGANSYWRVAVKQDVAVNFDATDNEISLKVGPTPVGAVKVSPIEYKWYAIGGVSA